MKTPQTILPQCFVHIKSVFLIAYIYFCLILHASLKKTGKFASFFRVFIKTSTPARHIERVIWLVLLDKTFKKLSNYYLCVTYELNWRKWLNYFLTFNSFPKSMSNFLKKKLLSSSNENYILLDYRCLMTREPPLVTKHTLTQIFIKYMHDIVLQISFLDINSQNWITGSCLNLW